MSFIQIVEFETDRPDELADLLSQSGPEQSFTRLALAQDRDNPRHHYMIVEFPPTRRPWPTAPGRRPTPSPGRWRR
ncbi:MAG TPA: hypothetical protein VKY81_11875 [Natronosporangium sp.]|nr:hypothetical protein [Natronosporangium sp.]